MNLTERIEAFSELGGILRDALAGKCTKYTSELNALIETQHLKNQWFTPDNVKMALMAIAGELTHGNLVKWTAMYPLLTKNNKPCSVGVIMAGNIPLVGFHDFLSVLITGNNIVARVSSKDSDLIRSISVILCDLKPEFLSRIKFAENLLSGFDAVIATGSDNTSRYFDYYFGKYPNIIRKNRNSVAVIRGDESESEFKALGKDIFSYFGLGCRNISKIFIPEGYDFTFMINSWKNFSHLVSHSGYANNYDFSKAVFLVNKESFIDTGFLLLKQESGLSSPVAVLYFEHYSTAEQIKTKLRDLNEKIQCITGKDFIPFGNAQSPYLWDYADGKDTIEFLLKKK
jgi:hypothetical protein